MANPNEDIVEIKYNDKVYEIKKIKEEQKVLPKGEIAPTDGTKHPNEITVKEYEENWRHTCEVDGKQFVIKWGNSLKIGVFGVLPTVVLLICIVIWYYTTKKDKIEDETL